MTLTACGGGDSASTSPAAAAAATGDGLKTALATSAATTSDATSTITASIATESGSFYINGTQTVRYGAGTSWTSKSVTGSGQCTNAFFGTDPAFGVVKTCVVDTADSGSSLPVGEGATFTVTGTQTVRYGQGVYWTLKSVTGTGTCSNDYFGKDPLFGTVKGCELVVGGSTSTTSGASVTAWVRAAVENDTYTPSGTQNIRFGDGMHWITKTTSNAVACSVNAFGSDPAYGAAKYCEVQLTVPAVTQVDGQMPVVNTALLPTRSPGSTSPRVRTLSAPELANGIFQPTASTVGSFREPCTISHMSFDDPIVYPGKAGASHLHMFAGNSDANAASTADSIAQSGGSTCQGGTLNRTAYWFPAIIDTRTGQPISPTSFNIYYKLGYYGVPAGTVKAFPKGLRILHGSASSSPTARDLSFTTRFACTSGGDWTSAIPSCPVGDTLMGAVVFPQCWDGVNLDSPDHKSHMAVGTGTGCPATHPVALPEITMNINVLITEANTGSYYKLSSDNYAGPGGYSLHADWFGGWDTATMQAFIDRCINGNMDCHESLLGDGRILY